MSTSNLDAGCFEWLLRAFMVDDYIESKRDEYYQIMASRVMWVIKLGD